MLYYIMTISTSLWNCISTGSMENKLNYIFGLLTNQLAKWKYLACFWCYTQWFFERKMLQTSGIQSHYRETKTHKATRSTAFRLNSSTTLCKLCLRWSPSLQASSWRCCNKLQSGTVQIFLIIAIIYKTYVRVIQQNNVGLFSKFQRLCKGVFD
jgi:hypothetical protein